MNLFFEGVLDEAQGGGADGVMGLHGEDDLLVDLGFECSCFGHKILSKVLILFWFVVSHPFAMNTKGRGNDLWRSRQQPKDVPKGELYRFWGNSVEFELIWAKGKICTEEYPHNSQMCVFCD